MFGKQSRYILEMVIGQLPHATRYTLTGQYGREDLSLMYLSSHKFASTENTMAASRESLGA